MQERQASYPGGQDTPSFAPSPIARSRKMEMDPYHPVMDQRDDDAATGEDDDVFGFGATLVSRATRGLAKAKEGFEKAKALVPNMDRLQDQDPYMIAQQEAVLSERPTVTTTDASERHREELKMAKETALRDARTIEARAAAEAREIRERLSEAKKELEQLQRRVQESEAREAKALKKSLKDTEMLEKEQRKARDAEDRAVQAEDASRVAREAAEVAQEDVGRLEAEIAGLRSGRDDIIETAQKQEARAAALQSRAASSTGALAEAQAQTATMAQQLVLAQDKAFRAEADAKHLKRKIAALKDQLRDKVIPETKDDPHEDHSSDPVASSSSSMLAATERAKQVRDYERQLAEAKRERSLVDARLAKVSAERDAATGALKAAERRIARAEVDRDDARVAQRQAESDRDEALKKRLDDGRILRAEATADAAKRQVRALDWALDAANARNAASAALRDHDIAALQARLDLANDQLVHCKRDLDAKRGQKAFYFSGEIRDELRRLELANDVLRDGGVHESKPTQNGGGGASDTTTVPPTLSNGHLESSSSFDARARCEYVARAVMTAADDPHVESATVIPVVREVLGAPHRHVAAIFDGIARQPPLANGCKAAMALVLEALEAARVQTSAIAQETAEKVHSQQDAKTAALVAATAIEVSSAVAEMTADFDQDLARARATVAARDAALRDLQENAALAVTKANTQLQDAVQLAKDRLTQIDDARRDTQRVKDSLEALQRQRDNDPELEHARQCVIAVLREAKVYGPAYNRLLPVIRSLLKQSHNVCVHNLNALISTGSGADFIEVHSFVSRVSHLFYRPSSPPLNSGSLCVGRTCRNTIHFCRNNNTPPV